MTRRKAQAALQATRARSRQRREARVAERAWRATTAEAAQSDLWWVRDGRVLADRCSVIAEAAIAGSPVDADGAWAAIADLETYLQALPADAWELAPEALNIIVLGVSALRQSLFEEGK